jgi:hypothetical protein
VSEAFDAFRLPRGITADRFETFTAGQLPCRYPQPTPALVEELAEAVRSAGRRLTHRTVADIVAVLDAAAARMADPGDPIRRTAERLVPAATGYSKAMTRLVLNRMSADWRAPALRRLLEAELGDPAALDGFVHAGPGRRTHAVGPELAFHVFAGNVPGVAVTSMVRSLLVKAPTLAKLASGEPVLPVLFADAVAAVDPDMGDAIALTYWPGGTDDAEARALAEADVVVVYGGEEAEAAFRNRTRPGQRLVTHGPRFSVGLIERASLDAGAEELARAVARAVAVFDQQGCVSPHAVWIEAPDRDRAHDFFDLVAQAMDAIEVELPRGELDAAEASLIHQERGAAELRGHAGGGARVLAGYGTRWTVVLDPDPAFRPSCLNRFLHLRPVDRLEDALDALAPHRRYLQSVALTVTDARRDDLSRRLARLGATRITTFARLPWPPPEWHHDGAGPLRELVHWIDMED